MATLNDVYLATVFGQYLGQQVINTYTYKVTGGASEVTTNAEIMANRLEEKIFSVDSPLRSAFFSEEATWSSMRCQNLFDLTDYFELVFSTTYEGAGTADAMPPFVAASLRTPWLGGTVRRGFKRYSGILEGTVSMGAFSAPMIASMQILADNLESILEEGDSVWTPVIVKRVKVIDGVTGAVTYRLPENLSESVTADATTWQVVTDATSQNSRKFGRGI